MKRNPLFPPEIIDFSVESLFHRNATRSNSIYFLFVLGIIAIGVAMPLVHIDLTTQSRGIIRSAVEENTLVTSAPGFISEIPIRQNQSVTKGDTIVIIQSQQILDSESFMTKRSELLITEINDLKVLVDTSANKKKFLNTKYLKTWNVHRQKINRLRVYNDFLRAEHDISKKLYNEGVIAEREYEQKRNELDRQSALLLFETQNQNALWESELFQLTSEHKKVLSELKRLQEEQRKYVLTAPINGTISGFSGLQEGNYVNAFQSIAVISPNSNLIVELFVSPQDIGMIHLGQEVKYQIDALNYNRWGLSYGKVIEISRRLMQKDGRASFSIICSLDKQILSLNEVLKTRLTKGLTLTGRMILTRRSLFDLLYDKVDQWMNPKMMST